jgi:hypothetical protein
MSMFKSTPPGNGNGNGNKPKAADPIPMRPRVPSREEHHPEPEMPQTAPPTLAIQDKRALEEMVRKVRQADKALFSHHKACLRRQLFTIVAEVRGIHHWSPREDAILDATTAWLIDLYFQEGASHDIVGESTATVQANATTIEDAEAAAAIGQLTPKP